MTTEVFNEFQPELRKEIEENRIPMSYSTRDVALYVGQNINVTPIVQLGVLRVSRLDDQGHEILFSKQKPTSKPVNGD